MEKTTNKRERAFAISASPQKIWRVLIKEVYSGVQLGRVTIIEERPYSFLELNVRLNKGLAVLYRYELIQSESYTEVSVTVEPYGIRYVLANIFSFGRGITPHMLAVTQGLANLKEVVEND